MIGRLLKLIVIVFALVTLCAPAARAADLKGAARFEMPGSYASMNSPQTSVVQEVRHQLLMLPYYDVFDWLEGEVLADGTVILRGEVTRPTLKTDAERSVREVKGVRRVVNEIEVLPASPDDDRLRAALYNAIYKFDSPLFRYATRAVPPIHIIVKNGRATLKGVVAAKADSDLAYTAASSVAGLFEVKNELRAESNVAR